MRLVHATTLAVLLVAATASAAPPTLELPAEVKGDPGAFVQVPAKTTGKTVQWKSIDPGLNLFPVELLKDTKTAVVTAAKPGRYRIIAVTAAGDELSPFAETVVVVGEAPPTPPGPNPPTPPDPPTPAPTGFRVIFVYESGELITAGQQLAMFSGEVEAYLKAKSVGWRRWDKDVDVANEKDASIKALWEAAKLKLGTVPCVIVAVNGKAEILPLPNGVEASLALLKKYGGE